jgi:hypothetical protein
MFYSNPFRPNLNQQGVILQDIQRANDSFYSLSQTYVNGDVASGKVLLAATADNAYSANHATSADSATNADNATNANHATTADVATYTDKMLVSASSLYNLGQYDRLKIYSNTPSLVISNQWGVNDYGDKGIFEVDLMLYGSNGFTLLWLPNNQSYSSSNFKSQYTLFYGSNAPTSSINLSWNGFAITVPYMNGAVKAFVKMRVCCNTDHKFIQYQGNAYNLSLATIQQEIANIFWNDSTSWDTVGGMYLIDTNYNLISSGYISGVIRRVL